mgnify:FL=1
MQILLSLLTTLILTPEYLEEPVVLAGSIDTYYQPPSFLLFDDGEMLFVDPDEKIRTIVLDDPASVGDFGCEWVPGTPEWTGNTNTLLQDISPDGSYICFTQQVRFPDSLQVEDTRIPGPVVVVVCRPDGSDARIVALSFDIGSSPFFGFTDDSRYLYGSMLGCHTTPEAFAAYVTREDDSDFIAGNMIDPRTGGRTEGSGILTGEGYNPNPWSDLATTGGYPPDKIIDTATGEVLFEDPEPGYSGVVTTWVLPDAGLAESDGAQVLRYADGSEIENTGPSIRVHAFLPDGRCLFSLEGQQDVKMLGHIDWESFVMSDTVSLEGLEEFALRNCRVFDGTETTWLVFSERQAIYAYRLPSTPL